LPSMILTLLIAIVAAPVGAAANAGAFAAIKPSSAHAPARPAKFHAATIDFFGMCCREFDMNCALK
jgi:hypothetical protein